jgi:serine/threonine protein kinase
LTVLRAGVAQFKREAQLLAALNLPNVAAIYGFGEANGVRSLMLELADDQPQGGPLR